MYVRWVGVGVVMGGGDARRDEAHIPENQGEFCFKKVWC